MRSILLGGLLLAASVHAADLSGSHDLPVLPRFPEAEIVDFVEPSTLRQRIYPQGPIRSISNQLRMDRKVETEGRQTSVTYRLPAGHSSGEAFDRARQDLLAGGAELLYWCQGRNCGSSSLWANTVFNNAKLYGSDEQQAYLLLRLAEPRQDSLVVLYGITRGNRRAYLHVVQVDASVPLGELLPTPDTLLRELKSSGELHLVRLPEEPSATWVTLLARSLSLDSTLRVSLAGFGAKAWREALAEQGVDTSRLELEEGGEPGLHLNLLR